MRTIALILTFFCFILVSSQETIRESRLNFRNLLSNPGAENGKSGVAVSNPAHLSISSVAANVAEGKSSFDWQPTAATNSIVFGVADFPQEYANASCLAKGLVRAGGNYSAGLLAIRVKSNGVAYTEDLDIGPVSAGDWKPFEIAFICPAYASGALDIEFEVTAGSVWKIDSLWLGKDYRIGESSPIITEWQSFTPTINNLTSSTSSWFKRRVGSSLEVRGGVTITSVTGTISLVIPDSLNIANGVDSRSTLGDVTATNTGTNFKIGNVVQQNSTAVIFLNDDATQFFNATVPFTWASGDMLHTNFTVEIAEWQNQGVSKTVTLETQGWHIKAEIGGSNTPIALSTQTTYIDILDSGITLNAYSGSAPVQIACQTGTASTGSTCTSPEAHGITFTAPYSGWFEVCAGISVLQRASAFSRSTFQLMRTSEISNVILEQGGDTAYMASEEVSVSQIDSRNLCGKFNLTAGRHTIRLMYELSISGGEAVQIIGDRNASNGDRHTLWTVKPLTQNFPQAVALPKADWQKRFLQSDIINTATPDISDLRFTGLETNKLYKICYQARMQISGNSASEIAQLNAKHNGVTIAIVEFRDDAGPIETRRQSAGTCTIFKALTNTLVFEHVVNGTVTVISGSSSTFAILEELPWHNNETTKWTP